MYTGWERGKAVNKILRKYESSHRHFYKKVLHTEVNYKVKDAIGLFDLIYIINLIVFIFFHTTDWSGTIYYLTKKYL